MPEFSADNQDFGAMVTDAAQIGAMAIRFAAKADAMAQEWAVRGARRENPVQQHDPLEPVRDAMRQYEAAVAAGQHGRMAAAQFVDAIYAVLNPNPVEMPVPVVTAAVERDEVAEIDEHAQPEWAASWDSAELTADTAAWGD